MRVTCSSLVGGQKLYLVTQLVVVRRDTLHPLPGLHPSWSEPSFRGTVCADVSVARAKGQRGPTFRALYLELPSTEIKMQ